MNAYIAAAILAVTSLVEAAPVNVNINAPIPGVEGATFYDNNAPAVKRQSGQVCIDFSSSVTWYYAFSGVWGSTTDQGPSSGQLCVPVTDSAGGALFLGPEPNPSAGSTKFECFFPTSGQSNCDVSLVDGYSLSLNCTSPDVSNAIGGSRDLFNYEGNVCPDQQGPNCINVNGGNASSQAGIDGFFQPAVYDGNNYCIWENCEQDYYFTASDGLSCTVSGSDT